MKNCKLDSGLVINLHFTNACNFHCKFCHSRFEKSKLSLQDWKKIIGNIMKGAKVKRFNLAGGEPLAAPYIQELIDHIHSVGVDCSLITNGYLLDSAFIRKNAGKVSMIGISVDGVSRQEDIAIGRADCHGNTLDKNRLIDLADEIHAAGITLKINTVVNALNQHCDFSALIGRLRPERWKILRMICIKDVNDSQTDLQVSDAQFRAFVKRHIDFAPVVEDSADIFHAYIVVDPEGRLVDNSSGAYRMSNPLATNPFDREFDRIGMDFDRYSKRYQSIA
ncbi:MAG: radical SAM protein [Lentisphaerae bacterium]|nr:radical SAM protein [Lentisphaerota bacterium]